jgi:hypothetical protein
MMCAALVAGCGSAPGPRSFAPDPVPHGVTADIQAGIEKHIAEQTLRGGGYFTIPFEGRELRLKLVRVHTEYLARVGPRRHFACVDLASTEGDVFDVDFFMAGDPGAMTVTETTIHKINGQPFYLWEQQEGGAWVRVPVEDASKYLLGVIEGSDRFEFLYQTTLPRLDDGARMWIPLPESDDFQTVVVKEIRAPGRQQVLTDKRHGNQVLLLTLGPEHGGAAVTLRFEVERLEKAAYADPAGSDDDGGEGDRPARERRGGGDDGAGRTVPPAVLEPHLAPERLVPERDEFRRIATEVLEGKSGDLVRARALYDHTIDCMRYMKFGEGYGRGDAARACDVGSGNCTDFHSYFIALARAAGIPARFAIGAAVPSERDDGGIDGYHCWAEFYAEGKWWPVDISEADKYSSLATYYFGHHPANRIELSRGRDLIVEPGPVSGPINFLAYPVLEVAGKPIPVTPQFAFRRITE